MIRKFLKFTSGVMFFSCSSASFLALDIAIPPVIVTEVIASNRFAIEEICGLVLTGDISTTIRLDSKSGWKEKEGQ